MNLNKNNEEHIQISSFIYSISTSNSHHFMDQMPTCLVLKKSTLYTGIIIFKFTT